MARHQFTIRVLDADGKPLAGAEVTARPETIGPLAKAGYDAKVEVYAFDGLRPGFFTIAVAHRGYEAQTRRIQVHRKPTEARFTLGRAGDAYLYRGAARTPYESRPELIGVIPASNVALPELLRLFTQLALEPQKPPSARAAGAWPTLPEDELPLTPAGIVVRLRDPRELARVLGALRAHVLVAAAGPIVWRKDTLVAVFTHRLHVRFRPEVTGAEAQALLGKESLTVVDSPAIAPGLYLVEAQSTIGEEMNAIAGRLVASGRVVYAEPVLADIPIAMGIVPTDYLWPGLWDRRLVKLAGDDNVPGAWQRLRDALGAAHQFGRPDTIIAVLDSGIKSVDGVVDHADFQGTVSDGSPKIYKLFNFDLLVPGNDEPVLFINDRVGDHGVACAGVAAARADDPSGVTGTAFGGAGAAPNTRLIGIGFPKDYYRRAKTYLWAAGLDPGTVEAGFPEPISPGADILTVSVGWGGGMALSGVEEDAFDRLTSHGRGGKGCLVFFAAGNDNREVYLSSAPASYERTLACAASTLDANGREVRADYSNWGDVIQWCAPSNSGSAGHNPPESYGVWTTAFVHRGPIPSRPAVIQTALVSVPTPAPQDQTSVQLTLADASELTSNLWLNIGELGAPGSETVPIFGLPDAATGHVLVRPLRTHAAGTPVSSGSKLLTALAQDAQQGDTAIVVQSTARLADGMDALLGSRGDPAGTRESFSFETSQSVPEGGGGVDAALSSPLRYAHPAGSPVLYTARYAFDIEVGHLEGSARAGDTALQVWLNESVPGAPFQLVLQDTVGEALHQRERVRIDTIVDAGAGIVRLTRPLERDHPLSAVPELVESHNHHRSDFGGTSSATPLCAGIAALVLSARPDLTWVEVRDILRTTAEKIDLDNTNEQGRWRDENGDACVESGRPAVFSRWYGYGRLDADRAVARALEYGLSRDLMIRNSLADTGTTIQPISADSPDIWVRNIDPAIDADAEPAQYDVPGPHQTPAADADRWVYARVRNRGTVTSLEAWVRFYVAAGAGPHRVPDDLSPLNPIDNFTYNAWTRGVYLIGEVAIDAVAPGDVEIVNLPWPEALLPPALGDDGEPWNPHLIVEVTPYDGPVRGSLVHENNNVALKAVTVEDRPPLVEFVDRDAQVPLAHEIEVVTGQRDLSVQVKISDAGRFRVETAVLRATFERRGGPALASSFAFIGAAWVEHSDAGLAQNAVFYQLPSPFADGNVEASGIVAEAFFNTTFKLDGSFREVRLQVEVSDLSGHAVQTTHAIEIAIPTDTMLLLDYSGSMLRADGGVPTKWDSAKEAANLFHTVYAALSSPTIDNRIGVVRFMHMSSNTLPVTGARETEVTVPLRTPNAAVPLVNSPPPGSPALMTPMGPALVKAHNAMKPTSSTAPWRQRVMILLTDGMENVLPRMDDIRAITDPTYTNFVPSVTELARVGYRIHACAFGPSGSVQTAGLQRLVMGDDDGLKHYDGQIHSTETTADPEAAADLKERFLNLMTDTLEAELVPRVGTSFTIEPGVSVLVLLVTAEIVLSVTAPPDHTDPLGPFLQGQGYSWVRVERPAAGTWTLGGFTPSTSVRPYAVVDLVLRVRSDAARENLAVGRPVPLWTEIRDAGVPIHGASVTVSVDGPGEAAGEVVSKYAAGRTFDRQKWKALLASSPQELPFRAELLGAALRERGYQLARNQARVTLTETGSSGRYEGVWPYTAEAGTYAFRFLVEGETRSGHPFRREYSVVRHLDAAPAPELTGMFIVLRPYAEYPTRPTKLLEYDVTITPRTAAGARLGPGLADTMTLALARIETPVALEDNLDGSYTAKLAVPPGTSPRDLVLHYGSARVPLTASPAAAHRVRVTLRRVQVLDDHEKWFPSPGELVFDSIVAPNGEPDRAVRRRIPATGSLPLGDGEYSQLDAVIYDGYVERGAGLDIVIGATEIDRILFLKLEDPLVRYRRRLTGDAPLWAGAYTPDDETDDPESRRDWRVWYDIAVL